MKGTVLLFVLFIVIIVICLFIGVFCDCKTIAPCHAKKSILFLIINLDKNLERYDKISSDLNGLKCEYVRIAAIDGKRMETDRDAQVILKPRVELLQNKFQCFETGEEWTYDGTVHKSFPNLHLNGHFGTKGLTLSNMKAFACASALSKVFDWFCVLEDDSKIDDESYNSIVHICATTSPSDTDIICMDRRSQSSVDLGGACAICYSSHIVDKCMEDLHPLSPFSIKSPTLGDSSRTNLWDWKLWKYVKYVNQNFIMYPKVDSGGYESTIG
jgi:hypothetical protein